MYNYHNHTRYCDGAAEPEAYCRAALEQGLLHLGFSAHAPVDFENSWSIKPENLSIYLDHINRCKKGYPGLKIFTGLEADFIPGRTRAFADYRAEGFEYIIGSVHLVSTPDTDALWFIDGPSEGYDAGLKQLFDNNIKQAIKAYYAQIRQMLEDEKPDIVGHIDKIHMHNRGRFFSTGDDWYRKELFETLEVVKSSRCILEVNTRGVYKGKTEVFFPSEDTIRQCFQMDIPLVISADAHKPEETGMLYSQALELLKQSGYKTAMRREEGCWVPYSLV